MRACDNPKLEKEQQQLFEEWCLKYKDTEYPEETLLEYGYAHGSKELIAHFERKRKQREWDKEHGCITN